MNQILTEYDKIVTALKCDIQGYTNLISEYKDKIKLEENNLLVVGEKNPYTS